MGQVMSIYGFLAGSVSKLVNKTLKTKLGFNPNIEIHSIYMNVCDPEDEDIPDGQDERVVNLNISVNMKKKDFDKFIEEVTK